MRYGKTAYGFGLVLLALTASASGVFAQSLIVSSAHPDFAAGKQGYNFNLPGQWNSYVVARANERDVSQPLYSPLNDPRQSDYRVKGGVAYDITEKLLGSLEYQWHQNFTSKVGLGEPRTKVEFKNRGFVLGLTYKTE